MVQNIPKAGRPLSFDRDAALEAAMHLFWDHGYHGVGLSDLESHTGLNRSSLYNSFGAKEALFTQTLAHYTDQLATAMLAPLVSGQAGLADIETFLRGLLQHLVAQRGRGCFMVNTMSATSDTQPDVAPLATQYVQRFLQTARAPLQRAAAQGEIPAARVEAAAQLLLGVVLGANVLARARQPASLIEAVLLSALQHLRPAGTMPAKSSS